MQNSRSDPAIQQCRAQDSVQSTRTTNSHVSNLARTRVGNAGKDYQHINNQISSESEKWSKSSLLGCIVPERTSASLAKRLHKRNSVREERKWVKNNFPRHNESPKRFLLCSNSDSKTTSAHSRKIIGREVAPNQFVLSFKKTSGGVSYTLGSETGGRGFFMLPPASLRKRSSLRVIESRLRKAGRRRRRLMDEKVERARAMSTLRRRPVSPDTTDTEVTEPVLRVPEVATRSTKPETADPTDQNSDPDAKGKKRSKKKKQGKKSGPEGTLWGKVSSLFANQPSKKTNIRDDDALLKEKTKYIAKQPETISLPERSFQEPSKQLKNTNLAPKPIKTKKRMQKLRRRKILTDAPLS